MRSVRSLIAALATFLLLSSFSSAVFAVTNDTALGVTAMVSSNSSNNDQPSDPPQNDTPPVISSVSITTATSSMQASWSVSDNNVVNSVVFEYGATASYGASAIVAGNYLTSLVGLTPNTTYYYRILATDNMPQTAVYTGTFITLNNADLTAPNISSIQSAAGVTSCTVTWNVNETASGEVTYGLTTQYGFSQSSNEGQALSHTANLLNLLSSTTYHYKIVATDSSGNSSSTPDLACRTLADTTPPGNPSSVVAATSTSAITITWTNPADSDFSGIRIRRSTGSTPGSNEGTLVYTGTEQNFTDNTVASGVMYYYSLFAYDTAGNLSSGVSVSERVVTPVINEVCGNNIDDNSNGLTDCADSACSSQPACQVQEVCNNGIDDNNNGDTDCSDTQCSGASYCKLTVEVCDNSLDDDRNGAIDCTDISCYAFPGCRSEVPTTTSQYVPPSSTVPTFTRLDLSHFTFLGGGRTFAMRQNNGAVTGLAGSSFIISIGRNVLPSVPEKFVAKINGSGEYQFTLFGDTYYADAVFPPIGSHSSFFEVNYGANQIDTIPFTLQSAGFGLVVSEGKPVSEATVILYGENGQPVSLNASNRLTTNQNGTYGWFVPNGKYSVHAYKEGFYDRNTPLVTVENNVVNVALDLVARPPELFENVSASSTVVENATVIVKNVAEKTKAVAKQSVEKIQDTIKVVEEIKKDPEVQKTARTVVAPAAVSVAAVGTVSLVSWSNLLPFLRLLFLQPLMLLGLRRRKGWGQVYNTLSKIPIDLATVRLVSDGKVIQSKVTDKQGRYAFVVNPGKYTIQVIKNGFSFPSVLLAKAHSDGRRTDIYHGEVIEVTEKDAVITANIPLDPAGETKRPTRLAWQRAGRVVQIALSWVGLLVTLASLYISPVWYVWLLLFVHAFLFLVFRRLAVPPKVKSWGIVYDANSKRPIGRTVARLFNSEFDKLVATQITDGGGRYYFMAGDDKYYVTYDHPEYASEKTEVIDLTGKDAETITVDVGLDKGKNVPPKPTPPTPRVAPTPSPAATPEPAIMSAASAVVEPVSAPEAPKLPQATSVPVLPVEPVVTTPPTAVDPVKAKAPKNEPVVVEFFTQPPDETKQP